MSEKTRIILLITFISCWFPFPSFAIELRTAAQDSAPKYYKTETNHMAGLCVDIIHAIERVDPGIRFNGYQEFVPFKRLQRQLEYGELDIFLGLKQTEKRKGKYIFLDVPLYQLNYVMAARSDDTVQIQTFDDVRSLHENGKILSVFGSAASRFLKKQGGLIINDGAESPFILLKMLKYERGRFAFYHDLGLQSTINKDGFVDDFKLFPVSFLTYYHYGAFSKNVPVEIITRVNNALETLKASGTLSEIHRKYTALK